jgi:hypothetical protein
MPPPPLSSGELAVKVGSFLNFDTFFKNSKDALLNLQNFCRFKR